MISRLLNRYPSQKAAGGSSVMRVSVINFWSKMGLHEQANQLGQPGNLTLPSLRPGLTKLRSGFLATSVVWTA